MGDGADLLIEQTEQECDLCGKFMAIEGHAKDCPVIAKENADWQTYTKPKGRK